MVIPTLVPAAPVTSVGVVVVLPRPLPLLRWFAVRPVGVVGLSGVVAVVPRHSFLGDHP